jgi:hypothetical protein
MPASLLAYEGFTEKQTQRIDRWIAAAREQLVRAYMREGRGMTRAKAEAQVRRMARKGIDEFRRTPTEVDRACFALDRYEEALVGSYERKNAAMLVSDAQVSMGRQTHAIGDPAMRLVRHFAYLMAALLLVEDSE